MRGRTEATRTAEPLLLVIMGRPREAVHSTLPCITKPDLGHAAFTHPPRQKTAQFCISRSAGGPSFPRPVEHSTRGALRGSGERDAPRGADCAPSPRQDSPERLEKRAQRGSWGNYLLSRLLPIIQRAVDKRWLRPRVSRTVLFP